MPLFQRKPLNFKKIFIEICSLGYNSALMQLTVGAEQATYPNLDQSLYNLVTHICVTGPQSTKRANCSGLKNSYHHPFWSDYGSISINILSPVRIIVYDRTCPLSSHCRVFPTGTLYIRYIKDPHVILLLESTLMSVFYASLNIMV